MTLSCGNVTLNIEGGGTRRLKYRSDPTRRPAQLDLIESCGDVDKCIYQLDGDTLKIATTIFQFEGVDYRPKVFDDNVEVKTYRRVK
jgi:uncharacterized protein (TIGR03067 family)